MYIASVASFRCYKYIFEGRVTPPAPENGYVGGSWSAPENGFQTHQKLRDSNLKCTFPFPVIFKNLDSRQFWSVKLVRDGHVEYGG